jgi:glycosyltransferase involved in cell wall biosynthesis
MRLLYVARRYWPAVGGVESYLRHLAHAIGERHQLTVLAQRVDNGPSSRLDDSLRPPPSFAPFRDGPVRVEPLIIPAARRMMLAPLAAHVVPGLRRYAYGPSRHLAASLHANVVAPALATRLRSADLVHMWGSDLLAATVMRAARLAGVPGVITPFAHRGQWGDDAASAMAYRTADRVVALLHAEAETYRDLGTPQARLDVCGVCSPGVASSGAEDIRRRHGIVGPLVLYLGVRRPHKGFDVLLEAVPHLARSHPQAVIAFVGPGPRLASSAAAIRVLDIGAVDDEQRAAWLSAADLLCLPSSGEIFPMAVLEAWSVATPVVTSDLPTLQELVGTAGGGVTVSRDPRTLGTAIAGLLDDPARLQAMGRAGRAFWAAKHTPEAVARWHESLYEALVTSRGTLACAS